MKPIVTVPHQVLTNKAVQITHIDKKIVQIIATMKQALKLSDNPKGVGLAAPQIGVSLRIFLIKPEDTSPIQVFINPEYISKSKSLVKGIPETEAKLEGCLSIPKIWGTVVRHKSVMIGFLDEKGNHHQASFSGFPSIIIQHEMDHLDGVLFTQRVIEQKGQLYRPTKNLKGEEILSPIDI